MHIVFVCRNTEYGILRQVQVVLVKYYELLENLQSQNSETIIILCDFLRARQKEKLSNSIVTVHDDEAGQYCIVIFNSLIFHARRAQKHSNFFYIIKMYLVRLFSLALML